MNPSDSKLAGNGFNRRRPVSVVRTYPAKVAITEQRRGDFSSYTATVNWCIPTEDCRSDSRNGGVSGCSRPVVRAVRDFPPFCGTNCPRLEKCLRGLVMNGGEDEQNKDKRALVSDNGGSKGVGVGYEEDDDDIDMEEEEMNGEGVGAGDDLEGKMGQYKMGIGSGIRGPQPIRSIARKSLGVETLASRQKSANVINVVEGESGKGGNPIPLSCFHEAQRRPLLPENRFSTVEGKGKSRDVGGEATATSGARDAHLQPPLPENRFRTAEFKGRSGDIGRDKDSFNRVPKRKFSSYNKTQFLEDSTPSAPKPLCPKSRPPRVGDREKVLDTLRLFREIFREVSRQGDVRRVDLVAADKLRKMNKCINKDSKIVGAIPGVEVGDVFQYRMELSIIGLHNQNQGGIDYTYRGGQMIAISVVDSGGYGNYVNGSGVLIYVGQGGADRRKPAEDQKLERGNLALKNSISNKNLVRVTRKQPKQSSSLHPRTAAEMYVYDGLYLVTKYWSERGVHGKMIFKFQLEKVAA